jgi:hypothetical protein
MREVAENVSEHRVPRTGHRIAEENADGFQKGFLAFSARPEKPAAKTKNPSMKMPGLANRPRTSGERSIAERFSSGF